MTVRHVVCFSWKPEVSEADVAGFEAMLRELPAKIPVIRTYRFGRDLGLAQGNADFAIIADFANEHDWRTYAQDPDHSIVIARSRELFASRTAIQFALD